MPTDGPRKSILDDIPTQQERLTREVTEGNLTRANVDGLVNASITLSWLGLTELCQSVLEVAELLGKEIDDAAKPRIPEARQD